MACEYRAGCEEFAFLFWPAIIYFWIIGIICYIALYQFWKICKEISNDNSFSKENMEALSVITTLAIVASGVWFIGLVALIISGVVSMGIFAFMGIAIVISLIIAVLASALSHLVHKAYVLKEESDLTI